MIELNMTTPMDTDTYYHLSVAGSVVGGEAQLKLCAVILNYKGANIPCHEPDNQLYITTTGSEPYDQMVWDLRRIRNTAMRFGFSNILYHTQFHDLGQILIMPGQGR